MNNRSWLVASMVFSLCFAAIHNTSGQVKPVPAGASRKTAAKPATAPAAPPLPAALQPGPAKVVAEHVNLRARADVDSEPVGKLSRNDTVQVIDQVVIAKPAPGEPSRWAKVAWPAGNPVWVFAGFVDQAGSTVKVPKINLRSGPGENHAVVGTLEKGAAVKKLDARGDWWKVEAPEGCAAFVAANLIQSKPPEPPAPAPATVVIHPARPPAPQARPLPIVPPPSPRPMPPPVVTELPSDTIVAVPPPAPAPRPAPTLVVPSSPGGYAGLGQPAAQPAPPPVRPVVAAPVPAATAPIPTRAPGQVDLRPIRESSFVKRSVTREGRVRRSYNIQSPTDMFLENLHNGRIMNYLYSTTTNLNLNAYRGRVVSVVGEEALDERWPNTPVIRVETLQTAP